MDIMVKEGRIKQEEADKMIEKYDRMIKNWDGKGYPMFHKPDSFNKELR
jgi:hypothetical protein